MVKQTAPQHLLAMQVHWKTERYNTEDDVKKEQQLWRGHAWESLKKGVSDTSTWVSVCITPVETQTYDWGRRITPLFTFVDKTTCFHKRRWNSVVRLSFKGWCYGFDRWASVSQYLSQPVLKALIQQSVGFVDNQKSQMLKGEIRSWGKMVH